MKIFWVYNCKIVNFKINIRIYIFEKEDEMFPYSIVTLTYLYNINLLYLYSLKHP